MSIRARTLTELTSREVKGFRRGGGVRATLRYVQSLVSKKRWKRMTAETTEDNVPVRVFKGEWYRCV